MSYTPGPWKVEDDDDGECWIRIPGGHDLNFGDMETTDSCCWANAHLIAAAPELFEALEDLDNALEKFHDEMSTRSWENVQSAQRQARAALAEARGIP